MEFHWTAIPFVRILLPFIMGILWGMFSHKYQVPDIWILWTVPVVIFLGIKRLKYHYRWLFGLFISIFLFQLGAFRYQQKDPIFQEGHFQYLYQKRDTLWCTLMGPAKQGKWYRMEVQVNRIRYNAIPCSGNLLVYLEADSNHFFPGQTIRIIGSIQAIPPPKNPGAFDFQKYMRNRMIRHQTFIRKGNWAIPKNEQVPIFYHLQQQAFATLKKHLKKQEQLGVAASIVLGVRQELPDELKQSYARAGAMHILAVSGLHVGMVYLILYQILRWCGKRTRLLQLGLSLAGIWAFALLTGATPSVIRASTMLTFILIGQQLRRSGNVYNALAGSAFFLLWFQPHWLLAPGFQLSYLAVGGIVFWQPLIYRIWIPTPSILHYIWKLTSVSIAAQISTFPISIYYFHQFPILFWVSGLVVVPLAPVMLVSGLSLIGMEMVWSNAALFLSQILGGSIELVNRSIIWLNSLPFNTIENISIQPIGVITCYFGAIGSTILLHNPSYRACKNFLWGLILLGLISLPGNYPKTQGNKLTVYHEKEGISLSLLTGKKGYAFYSNSISEHPVKQHARSNKILFLPLTKDWIELGAINIYLFHPDHNFAEIQKDIDITIISDNPSVDLETLPNEICKSKLLFAANNDNRQIRRWMKDCEKLNLDCYDIRSKGAYTQEVSGIKSVSSKKDLR